MKQTTASYLEGFGIRASLQRIAIMDYMLSHRIHPTADQVYVSLLGIMPTLSKMTVYNTLQLFAERGAVLSLGVDPRHRRFDGDTSLHGHLLCYECGAVEDIFYQPEQIQALRQTMPDRKNCSLEVIYNGLCQGCQGKESNSAADGLPSNGAHNRNC